MARILFSPTTADAKPKKNNHTSPQLLSIDIQERACANTRKALRLTLSDHVMENYVEVLQTSHAPLPVPKDTRSVSLVVYNLGYLPSADNKTVMTSTETTLTSLADASLLLRIGGMISVMTYPRTNPEEDFAIRSFLEGLALFSSSTLPWDTFIDELDALQCSDELRHRLRVTLQYVLVEGGKEQTWRVHEHKKLGWVAAPILLTATKIK
jgi:Putative rRNA methylase